MSKRKTFRRVKVGNRGYEPGKRGQIFSRPAPKAKPAGGIYLTAANGERRYIGTLKPAGQKEETTN